MKLKKILFSPAVTIAAFVLAAALLLFSTVGGARAALTYISGTYQAQMELKHIGVTLLENGEKVAYQNFSKDDTLSAPVNGELLQNVEDPEEPNNKFESFTLGKEYTEKLEVQNTGTIGQYVRVTIYRYWVDGSNAEGKTLSELPKLRELNPDFIQLHVLTDNGDWVEDTDAATTERNVYYYTKLLNPGDVTVPLSDTLTVDGNLKATVTEELQPDKHTYKIKYDYNGIKFVLEAAVDAVQENNAQAAALSAWGRNVTIENGTLTLGPTAGNKPATGETAEPAEPGETGPETEAGGTEGEGEGTEGEGENQNQNGNGNQTNSDPGDGHGVGGDTVVFGE